MKFKDIVNYDVVNITNCEHEPIHIPGSIQPHGFLLAVKIPDLLICFCSGNSFEFTGLKYEQLLGKGFGIIFGEKEEKRLVKFISHDGSSTTPLQIELMNKKFECTVQTTADLYVLEFEPWSNQKPTVVNRYLEAKQLVSIQKVQVHFKRFARL